MGKDYIQLANNARKKVLEMIWKAQTSHIGSNFSAIDLLTVLYDIAKVEDKTDRVIISKGWIGASAYYFLSEKGLVPKEDLDTFCQPGSKYIGLLEPSVNGVDAAGGSMGFGLPFAVGFALAKKIAKENGRIFVLMGDGEVAIGTTWESALIAVQHKLNNLTVIIDANGLQAMGLVKDVLNIEPLKEKWQAFGWNVAEIDGHNYDDIKKALFENQDSSKPSIIIAKTVKGKGVSFMENNNMYHYKELSDKEYQDALLELSK
ncbi:MAG: transketolase [Candidatus Staskawiczbacteria bacterium]|jgi:transketolase